MMGGRYVFSAGDGRVPVSLRTMVTMGVSGVDFGFIVFVRWDGWDDWNARRCPIHP